MTQACKPSERAILNPIVGFLGSIGFPFHKNLISLSWMPWIASPFFNRINQLADRWTCDKQAASIEQPWHPTVEEPKHQRASMDAVSIRIKQQDDLVESALAQFESIRETCVNGLDKLLKQCIVYDFRLGGLPCIHRLSLHRQNRLKFWIANSMNSRSSRLSLH